MVLKIYDTGTITATGTTDTKNTDRIVGKILKIQIIASASTDFKIWIDASDTTTSVIVDEYIVGASGSVVTVNTTTTLYPGEQIFDTAQTTPATYDPDGYTPFVVSDRLEISVSNIANSETYRVVIWYDDMTDRQL